MTDPKIQRLSNAIAEAIAAMIALAQDGDASGQVALTDVKEAAEPAAARRARPSKAEPALSADAAQSSSDSATSASSSSQEATSSLKEPNAPSESSTEPCTRADAAALTVELAKAKGREAPAAILVSFNALKDDGKPSVVALAEDAIDAYCEAIREALAA